jgi:hypothetical protein
VPASPYLSTPGLTRQPPALAGLTCQPCSSLFGLGPTYHFPLALRPLLSTSHCRVLVLLPCHPPILSLSLTPATRHAAYKIHMRSTLPSFPSRDQVSTQEHLGDNYTLPQCRCIHSGGQSMHLLPEFGRTATPIELLSLSLQYISGLISLPLSLSCRSTLSHCRPLFNLPPPTDAATQHGFCHFAVDPPFRRASALSSLPGALPMGRFRTPPLATGNRAA